VELRRYPRITVEFGSTFKGDQIAGQGTLVDLSFGGCRIKSKVKVRQGLKLGVQIALPDEEWPLQIEECDVRWTDGKVFGLEFTQLRPDQHARITRILDDLEEGPLVVMKKV